MIREQEINEIKQETEIKSNTLNEEINDISKNLQFELEHGTLKNRYFKKLNRREGRIKLRLSEKEEINEIEKLKEEVKNNVDELLNAETEISKSLTDLKFEKKKDIFNNIITSESKLIKLGIPPIQIDKINDSISSS